MRVYISIFFYRLSKMYHNFNILQKIDYSNKLYSLIVKGQMLLLAISRQINGKSNFSKIKK